MRKRGQSQRSRKDDGRVAMAARNLEGNVTFDRKTGNLGRNNGDSIKRIRYRVEYHPLNCTYVYPSNDEFESRFHISANISLSKALLTFKSSSVLPTSL